MAGIYELKIWAYPLTKAIISSNPMQAFLYKVISYEGPLNTYFNPIT